MVLCFGISGFQGPWLSRGLRVYGRVLAIMQTAVGVWCSLVGLVDRTLLGDILGGPGVFFFPNVGPGLFALVTLAPGLLVIWSPGPVVPWSSGPLVLWSSPLVPRSSGPVVLWFRGPRVPRAPRSLGPAVLWSSVPWSPGTAVI